MEKISSLQIAKLTGKRHYNILKAIEKMAIEMDINPEEYVSYYTCKRNQERKCYVINREIADARFLNPVTKFQQMGIRESVALDTIEQLLNISLVRQYKVDSYRIDGYDPINNVAYEVDEKQHFVRGELRQECINRQKYIEDKLGCTTVRIRV